MSLEALPGLLSVKEAHGETTAVVEASRLREACAYLRDEQGFNFLSDISAADYLGYGARGVSGYIATAAGRDLNVPMTQGLQATPEGKPKRFAVNYHLLALSDAPRRLRHVQVLGFRAEDANASRASSTSGGPRTGTSARPTT